MTAEQDFAEILNAGPTEDRYHERERWLNQIRRLSPDAEHWLTAALTVIRHCALPYWEAAFPGDLTQVQVLREMHRLLKLGNTAELLSLFHDHANRREWIAFEESEESNEETAYIAVGEVIQFAAEHSAGEESWRERGFDSLRHLVGQSPEAWKHVQSAVRGLGERWA